MVIREMVLGTKVVTPPCKIADSFALIHGKSENVEFVPWMSALLHSSMENVVDTNCAFCLPSLTT